MLSIIKKFLDHLVSKPSKLYDIIHQRQPISAKEFIELMQNPVYDEKLVDTVREIVSKEVIAKHKITYYHLYPKDVLIDDLGICKIDALDYTIIIIKLESTLDINIPDKEAENVRTLEDLINLCAKYYCLKFKER